MNITKFKSISEEIRKSFILDIEKSLEKDPTMSLCDFKVKSHAQMIQLLAQSLYSKPYEEVKETILSNNKKEKNKYYIICSGTLSFCFKDENLLIKGDYFSSKVKKFNTDFNPTCFFIPDIAFGTFGFTDDEAFKISLFFAKKMGCFDYKENIFDLINNSDVILIDGLTSSFRFDSEWISEIVSDNVDLFFDFKESTKEEKSVFMADLETSLKPLLDSSIWHDELNGRFGIIETFFSFNDLCKAKRNEDNHSQWDASEFFVNHKISFFN